MRPKSGLPKRKALRAVAVYKHGLKDSSFSKSIESEKPKPLLSAVSFFSGCGGLDLGIRGGFTYLDKVYESLPIQILKAYDNDVASVETYKLNIDENIEVADLTSIEMSQVPAADLLLGGFPCQDFSSSGPKTGLDGKRGRLFEVMVDYMFFHKPKYVIAENVKHLARMSNGEVLKHIITKMEEPGYKFQVWTVNCPEFGLPQSRTRLFLVGIRNDIDSHPTMPRKHGNQTIVSIENALRDLESIVDESIPNQSQRFVATKASAGAGQGDQVSIADKVAFCVRANPKGRIQFHYKLDRRLTVRECARLQSFPDEFVFPHSATANIKQIGNAVPPIIGHLIASSLLDFILGYEDENVEFCVDEQLSLFETLAN